MDTPLVPENVVPPNVPSWDLQATVTELLAIRAQSLSTRSTAPSWKVPSANAVGRIIDNLAAALFPRRLAREGRLECVETNACGLAFFIGDTLEHTFQDLTEQVYRELTFFAREGDHLLDSQSQPDWAGTARRKRLQALQIVADFCRVLPDIRRLLDTDIEAAFRGDPAAISPDEILLCYPGITSMIHHRVSHQLHRLGAPVIARMIAEHAHSKTGVDIHPGAQIGHSFFVDHGTGVVIGGTSIIGDRVRIYQGVTLGAVRFPSDETGNLLKGLPRHPILENDVVVYAGATILGRITIGAGSVIGGNVWLTKSVPPSSQISQARVRTEHFDDGGGI